MCACDGTVIQACGFAEYGFASKPSPVSPFFPPSPGPAGPVDEGAWCMNAVAHASDAGCGADVSLYNCAPTGADAGGCAALEDGGSTAAYYPEHCGAILAGCGAATIPPSPVSCTCVGAGDGAVPPSGGPAWVCPL